MVMIKIITLSILFVFNTSLLFAQKEKMQTVKVRGEYTVLSTSSALEWQQAPQLARENAKLNAIEKVCGSKISAWNQVEMSATGETFNSLTQVQHDGEIVEFTIINEGAFRSDVRHIETIFYCEARVVVKRGVAVDPNFIVDVSGIKPVYYDGEAIQFKVIPYQDCWLKIFIFENDSLGYRIYPNNIEQPSLLNARQEMFFPTIKHYEYSVFKSTNNSFETNRLVLVFTKEELPFYMETYSRAEIEKWIALIPNDKKFLYSVAFDIKQP